MDIDKLSGKDLDRYGESIGISRYQGLGLPESDSDYRKSIYGNLPSKKEKVNLDNSAGFPARVYAIVFIPDGFASPKICISDERPEIFRLLEQAKEALVKWSVGLSASRYCIKEVTYANIIELDSQ